MTSSRLPFPVGVTKHIIAVVCLVGLVRSEYFTGYLRDTCLCTNRPQCTAGQSSFTLSPLDGDGAGYLLLSRDKLAYQSDAGIEYRCTYKIVAPPTMVVLIKINSVKIPMTSSLENEMIGGGAGSGCRVGALQIFDGNSTNDVDKLLIETCGSALPTEVLFLSTAREMSFFYYQSVHVDREPISFNLTFTYVAVRKGGCLVKEFSCKSNTHCIASTLLCDGVRNCLDGSDESSDFDSCGRFLPASNPFVGTTVGVTLFLFFGLLICVAIARVKKQRPTGSGSTVALRGTTSGDLTSNACLSENNPSDNNLFLSANHNRQGASRDVSDDNLVSFTPDSRIIPCLGQGQTFQPLILVAGSRHVTVVAMAPHGGQDQDVRCTPPPPYESLFPETTPSCETNP